ncbi:hypothetical protein ACTWPT_27400 [Nonomuraea sp. 3N208]|uniref:hypothetical protein n=1 Tax=Nonomuraea sp. 3N208 TaxID=3457421 RepID=UPI003FD64F67
MDRLRHERSIRLPRIGIRKRTCGGATELRVHGVAGAPPEGTLKSYGEALDRLAGVKR